MWSKRVSEKENWEEWHATENSIVDTKKHKPSSSIYGQTIEGGSMGLKS